MKRKCLLAIVLFGLVSCGETVTIVDPDPSIATTITLSSEALSFSSLGATQILTATVLDQDGTVMTGAAVTWSSSASQVATVSIGGVVAAVGPGVATVTAAAGEATAMSTITVAQLPASVTLSPDTPLSLAGPGDEATVTAIVTDAGGSEIPDPILTWSSDDETIARVNGGEVEATGVGSTTIMVTAEGGTVQVTAMLDLSVGDAALVNAGGGQFSLSADAVNLMIPAGAVTGPVFVDAEPSLSLPTAPLAIPKTAFDLTPDGTRFDQPVTVTIDYDPAEVPAGVPEDELRIHKVVGEEYVEIAGGAVDLTGTTVSGTIDGFSIYAIVPRIRVTTTTLPIGVEGVAYSGTLSATGGTASYSWAVVAGTLPAGLTLTVNGDITGTPVAPGAFDVTVEVMSGGQTRQQSLSLTVEGTLAVTTIALPVGVQNTDYGMLALAATGGNETYAWQLAPGSGPLPAGMSLAANGDITGAPAEAGTSTLIVEVTSGAQTARATLTLQVDATLSLTTTAVLDGVLNVAYTYTLAATGGDGSFSWALAGGSLPAGLSLDTDGRITGTPSTAGTTSATLSVTSGSQSVQQAFDLTVHPTLSVTASVLPDAIQGVAYAQSLSALGGDGSHVWSLTAGALPIGMDMSPGGQITGAPTVLGTTGFTVEVTSGSQAAQQDLSITVRPPLVVTTASLRRGVVGTDYGTELFTAAGGDGSYTWQLAPGSTPLPAGMSLATHGEMTGTPTVAGTFTLVLEVTSGTQAAQATFTLQVDATLTVTTTFLVDGVVSVAYADTLAAIGGDGDYSWALAGGSLPPGLTLAADGRITGTPSTAGTASVTLSVTSGSQSVQRAFDITVHPSLSVTTTSLPAAVQDVAYSQALSALGGGGSYAWAVAPGSAPLPPGLSLSSSGMITGTPSTAGTSTFTVVVTSGAQSAERALSITVHPVLTITTTSLPNGVVGVDYGAEALIAGGGTGVYAWALAAGSGSLPPGLTLATDGTLTGTPTTAAVFDFTVEVTSGAQTVQQALSITVRALTVTTTSLPSGSPNIDYGVVPLSAAGGDGTYVWTLFSGSLPTGLDLAANGDVTGVPTMVETALFTVEVASAGLTAQATLSITITPSLNLSVDIVHLNQGNQSLMGEIGGIAQRPGLLRVMVRANEVNTLTPQVRVRLYDGAAMLREEFLSAPLAGVPVAPDLANLDDTWNLTLGAADIVPGLAVEVLVDPTGSIQESDVSDNVYPLGGGTLDLDVQSRQPLKVLFIPIQSTFHNTLGSLTASNADDFLESTWQWMPTSPISWNMHAAFSSGEDLSTEDGWSTLLSDIQALRTAEGATDEYYHGIIGDFPTIRYGGLAYRPGSPTSSFRSGLSYDRWPFSKETIGHELGHNLGRRHAPCGNPGGPDPDFPHPDAEIGFPGYDIVTGALVPSDDPDYMSYCSPEWTSDYTYNAIRDWRLADVLADPMIAASRSAPSQGVLLWGRIHSGGVVLEPAITMDAVASLPSTTGQNTLRGLAADGREIFGFSFEGTPVSDTADPNERHFAFFVPLDALSSDALDRIIIDSPRGSAIRTAVPAVGQSGAAIVAAPPETLTPIGGEAVRVRWDAERYPMAVVREAATGQILMFARGGDAVTALGGMDLERLEVVVSDGVKSRTLMR